MDIDEKLSKSLDELIKEEEKNRKSAKGGSRGANHGKRGVGRPSTGRGRGERRDGSDKMDVDPPAGGGSRPLKPQGGVQKVLASEFVVLCHVLPQTAASFCSHFPESLPLATFCDRAKWPAEEN
jgi:hypothetical protein